MEVNLSALVLTDIDAENSENMFFFRNVAKIGFAEIDRSCGRINRESRIVSCRKILSQTLSELLSQILPENVSGIWSNDSSEIWSKIWSEISSQMWFEIFPEFVQDFGILFLNYIRNCG